MGVLEAHQELGIMAQWTTWQVSDGARLMNSARNVHAYGFPIIPMYSDLRFRCYAGRVKFVRNQCCHNSYGFGPQILLLCWHGKIITVENHSVAIIPMDLDLRFCRYAGKVKKKKIAVRNHSVAIIPMDLDLRFCCYACELVINPQQLPSQSEIMVSP